MPCVQFTELQLTFVKALVERRLKELHLYHVEHPELPRQDDTVLVYEGTRNSLIAAVR